MKIFVILLLAFLCGAQISPRVTDIDGIPVDWLRTPQPGTPFAGSDRYATPVPKQPLSMRVLYRIRQDRWLSTDLPVDPERVVVGGVSMKATANTMPQIKLLAPDQTDCAGTAWRGIAPFAADTASLTDTTAYFIFPQQATLNDELIHEFLMPWVCICVGNTWNLKDALGNPLPDTDCPTNGGGNWVHSNMRYSYLLGCEGDDLTFGAWNNIGLATPFKHTLCATRFATDSIYPNRSPRADWGETYTGLQAIRDITTTATLATPADGLSSRLYNERKMRTKCCGWRENVANFVSRTYQFTDGTYGGTLSRRFGICINPLLENCCVRRLSTVQGTHDNYIGAYSGIGKPYSRFREKCCYGGYFSTLSDYSATTNPNIIPPEPVIINYLDDACPCKRSQVNLHCNIQVPTVNSTFGCCINSKYNELLYSSTQTTTTSSTVSGTLGYENQLWGKCYDGVSLKCCDTGDLYDPGSKQCCKINGLQSLNVPCPCEIDSHCGTNQTCCQDTSLRMMFPTPWEKGTSLCNKYINYPSGTGPYHAQTCIGQCIDTRFQICCNGMACIDEYEVCCNSTCCNKFNERCTMGLVHGARNQFFNPRHFRVPYEICTEKEGMTPFRATLAYFLPLCLLAATFISLFSALNFAKRQSALQPLSIYEKAIFCMAFVSIMLAWPDFFSPLYKYGIVWVWGQFFVLLAALSQLRALNVTAIVILGIILNYVVDPFFGNEIVNLSYRRNPPPVSGVHGWSGIISSIAMHIVFDYNYCQSWYDYFGRDENVEDRVRWDNPLKYSYGFCAHGWYVTLAVLNGINIIVTFVLFFLTLITHIRNVLFEKAQKTDDVVRQPWY